MYLYPFSIWNLRPRRVTFQVSGPRYSWSYTRTEPFCMTELACTGRSLPWALSQRRHASAVLWYIFCTVYTCMYEPSNVDRKFDFPISCLWVWKLTKRFCTSHSLSTKIETCARDPIWQTDDVLAGPSHAHLGMSFVLCCGDANDPLNSVEKSSMPFDVGLKMALLQTHVSEPRLHFTPRKDRTFRSSSSGTPRLWSTALRDASCTHGGSPSSSEIPQDMQCPSVKAGGCCDIREVGVASALHEPQISYPCGNAPMQWLQISYWFLTIRVPKWWGLRNLQIFEANISFLLWNCALVNLVVMNLILALDAAVVRWDPSVPSMFGSSVAMAWSDRLSAKQPQIFEITSGCVPVSGSPESLAWQNAKRWMKTSKCTNMSCQFSVGMESDIAPRAQL